MSDRPDPRLRALGCISICSGVFVLAFLLGERSAVMPNNDVDEMALSAIAVDLAYYQGKLHNASRAGCHMSIGEFRRYHSLKDEFENRQPTGQ